MGNPFSYMCSQRSYEIMYKYYFTVSGVNIYFKKTLGKMEENRKKGDEAERRVQFHSINLTWCNFVLGLQCNDDYVMYNM